jgi:hypothetical protein
MPPQQQYSQSNEEEPYHILKTNNPYTFYVPDKYISLCQRRRRIPLSVSAAAEATYIPGSGGGVHPSVSGSGGGVYPTGAHGTDHPLFLTFCLQIYFQ